MMAARTAPLAGIPKDKLGYVMLKTYIVVLLLYRPKRAGLLTFLLCYCDRQDATALVFGETKGVLSRNPAVRRFFVGRASTSSA